MVIHSIFFSFEKGIFRLFYTWCAFFWSLDWILLTKLWRAFPFANISSSSRRRKWKAESSVHRPVMEVHPFSIPAWTDLADLHEAEKQGTGPTGYRQSFQGSAQAAHTPRRLKGSGLVIGFPAGWVRWAEAGVWEGRDIDDVALSLWLCHSSHLVPCVAQRRADPKLLLLLPMLKAHSVSHRPCYHNLAE